MSYGHQSRPPLARPIPWPGADDPSADAPEPLPPDPATEPPPRQEATDPTGMVGVVVDARARVEAVRISSRWRDRLDADGLCEALLDTYRTARQQAVSAFVTASRAARAAGRPLSELLAAPVGSPVGPGRPPDRTRDRAAWLRWLDDTRAHTEATTRRTAELVAAIDRGPRTRTGPHGYFTATVQGGITAITGDARSIWYAATEDLEEDALAVMNPEDRA